ncbi:MAG: class II glutamine amidotransferase [Candidatus Tectomicrobia bacterium]|nr:class II glutamine amidotransferase [Candidatus Tectomicrobia bacterium]
MCRLYGFRATEPTKVECSLVHAQNAIMVQSRGDQAGITHAHGWGVATYTDRIPQVERQAWAAYHGEHFRRTAARVFSRTVVAHVRRASVGSVSLDNTHPFVHGKWVFAHNGTLRAFDAMREWMLDAMTDEHRMAIRGATDSEHVFHFVLSLWATRPNLTPGEALRAGLQQVIAQSRKTDADAAIGLNILLTNGEELVGARWGRTLWYVERDKVQDCEICGFPHIHHDPNAHYQAAVIASEPISDEPWAAVPEDTIFRVTPDMRLQFEPLM